MKQILKLVFLLVIGQTAFAQAPSNYTNINGRYRWIAGMFDSTFHIPKGSTPSLRTGGSTNSGGLFYNTSDSSVYTYTGTQWIKLRGSINPSDTTNKYVTQVYKKSGSDSIFYVKGGVHTWAFNDSTGSPGGGGGGKVYYFNGGVDMGTIGGLQMYELGDTANTGAAANFTRSTTGNIANFITDPGKPGLLEIPAGVWSVDAWLSETGGGANHAEIWVEVEKWDGSTITTIATSPIEQITEGATPNLYSWSVSIPTTSLTVTDRIVIQFYISNTNGKTVTLYTQNGYVGEVHTTFTTGIGAINGLTAPAQYLVTGTSGTDFNINSSTATHTFNLPTASATNRGALSTTDWSTFNNKIGGSLVSGYLTKATGTNTIDTSQIFQSNGKIGIGRTNPTAKVDVYDSLGTSIKSTMRAQINTDVALDVKTVGNRGFALIIDQADSVASGTQYQTLFRKSMMPGTGNPANGGGVSWYTQIGNDNNVYRALSVYRARVIDSTGFANSNIQQTSTEFWTRKAGVWDTTLVLNGGNVGINTGQNGIDSALTVANGTWLKRGVRMSALPTGVGTKAVRIDANGTLSVADTLTNGVSGSGTTNYVSKFTGSGTIGNSQIFDNASAVGINTITPTSGIRLDVNGNIQAKNEITVQGRDSDGLGTIWLNDVSSSFSYLQGTPSSNEFRFWVRSNGKYKFSIDNTEMIRVNTTGVGIGTITPDSLLTVNLGTHLKRGVRMSGLPTGVGTKSLRVDANGTVSLADTLANGISGTGTTNYIPKFTSSSAIGNSQIFDNGTNVGINNTTPSYKLTIQANGASESALGFIDVNTNGRTWLIGPGVGTGSAADFGFYNNTASQLAFLFTTGASAKWAWYTAGSERMRLDASGNLGLGTSSPQSILHLYKASADALLTIERSDGGSGAREAVKHIVGSSTKWTLGTVNTSDFYINVNSAERLRIDASGNLLLGMTTAPSDGALAIKRTGSPAAAIKFHNASTGDSGSDGLYLGYGGSDGTIAYLYQRENDAMVFGTNNTERMRLDASGNLGLGTSSPTQKLNIASDGYNFRIANISNAQGYNIGRNVTDGLLYFYGDQSGANGYVFTGVNGERMRLDASGNLGLGVTPSAWYTGYTALQVGESASLFSNRTSADTRTTQLANNAYLNTGATNWIYAQTDEATRYGQVSGEHQWFTAPSGTAGNAISFTQAMTLNASGNLLVGGTSDNGSRLQVTGTATFSNTVQVGTGSTTPSIFTLYPSASAKGWQITANNYVASALEFTPATANGGTTFTTPAMLITSGGNVGIGTTSPTGLLHLYGADPAFRIQSSTTGNMQFGQWDATNNRIQSSGRDFYLVGTDSYATIFGTNNTERMRITSGGNVGIGTTSPEAKLDVFGSSSDQIRLRTAASEYYRIGRNASTGYLDFWGSQSGYVGYTWSGVNGERMRLDASGNLGLGVTPSAWNSPFTALQIKTASISSDNSNNASFVNNAYFDGTNWRYINSSTAQQYLQYLGQHIWLNSSSGTAGNAISFTQAMTLDASGNLGIGSTTPSTSLGGAKGLVINSGAIGDAQFRLQNNNTGSASSDGALLSLASDNSMYLYNYENATINFGTNNAIRAVITGSGNVGIGTTSPTGYTGANLVLHLNTSSTITDLKLTNGTTGTAALAGGLLRQDGRAMYLWNVENSFLSFGTNNGEAMRITSGGEVGIGTTADLARTTILSDANAQTIGLIGRSVDNISTIRWWNNAGNTIYTAIESNANYTIYNTVTNGYAAFLTNNTERMRITSGGDIGISANSVIGSGFGYAGNTVSSASAYLQLYNGSSGETKLWNTGYYAMIFGNGNSERMRLNSGGELLINTTSDAGDYKLQVNGNAYAGGDLAIVTGAGAGKKLYMLGNTAQVNWMIAAQQNVDGSIEITPSTTAGGSTFTTPAFQVNSSGNGIFGGSIKTAAPSGGTAAAWKLGERVASSGVTFNDQQYIQLDIGGTLYYLATVDLPMPEAYPQATSGPSNNYKITPVQVKTTRDAEIEKLRKEIEELKQLIKNK